MTSHHNLDPAFRDFDGYNPLAIDGDVLLARDQEVGDKHSGAETDLAIAAAQAGHDSAFMQLLDQRLPLAMKLHKAKTAEEPLAADLEDAVQDAALATLVTLASMRRLGETNAAQFLTRNIKETHSTDYSSRSFASGQETPVGHGLRGIAEQHGAVCGVEPGVFKAEQADLLDRQLSALEPRRARVLSQLYSLERLQDYDDAPEDPKDSYDTLRAVGKHIGVSNEVVRRIEGQTMKQLAATGGFANRMYNSHADEVTDINAGLGTGGFDDWRRGSQGQYTLAVKLSQRQAELEAHDERKREATIPGYKAIKLAEAAGVAYAQWQNRVAFAKDFGIKSDGTSEYFESEYLEAVRLASLEMAEYGLEAPDILDEAA